MHSQQRTSCRADAEQPRAEAGNPSLSWKTAWLRGLYAAACGDAVALEAAAWRLAKRSGYGRRTRRQRTGGRAACHGGRRHDAKVWRLPQQRALEALLCLWRHGKCVDSALRSGTEPAPQGAAAPSSAFARAHPMQARSGSAQKAPPTVQRGVRDGSKETHGGPPRPKALPSGVGSCFPGALRAVRKDIRQRLQKTNRGGLPVAVMAAGRET